MARLEFVGREELEALNKLEMWVAADPSSRSYEVRRRTPTKQDPISHRVFLTSQRRDWHRYDRPGMGTSLAEAARVALEAYPKRRKRAGK